jgi:hypothetical protein
MTGRGKGAAHQQRSFVVCSLRGLAMVSGWIVSIDLQTVICQVPSVSRAIVAAAKLHQPADASKTLRWRPFNQA